MQPIINVRATIVAMPVGEHYQFKKTETRERYVAHLCSILGYEMGRRYTVSSPRDSEFITVTRTE